ncbi:hypothetical protein O1611_g9970 [Lasiodiplodia mahajangana]|uniref:Uncharacterized protein n=1 Tax=Lasiodiplodia mahajangana TaxID=1108764 RepID=A0ACC2J3A4_9PEZI|nr:hypothetical protein O1611_g9970 [Lasiodiplodia mahajangana]
MEDMTKPTLPQDIMLLICQELGARREFTTLYHCSMAGSRLASLAVEQLYGIMEIMDPFIESKLQAARLWRSILLSSRGATLYPYCAYIRALSLGRLVDCLDDIRPDLSLRDFFFEGLMDHFLVLQESNRPPKSTRSRLPPLDNIEIIKRCADSITQYIKGLADSNGTAVALTHLEASSVQPNTLPTWISRLGTLTSLRLQDGSVLGVEATRAIAEYCPNFVELTCFHFQSRTAAEDMEAFFRALRPNSLQSFEVLSRNNLGQVTLSALSTHARSLRVLHLRSLLPSAVKSLHLLSDCTALESLDIETTNRRELDNFSEAEFTQIAKWISSCKGLRELSFSHFRDALPLLKQVLEAPDIRLERLEVQDYQSASQEITKATWRALGQQDRLELLTIASQDGLPDGLVLNQHPELTDSICRLSNLVSLNLIQAYVNSVEIRRIVAALPRLEELSFGGSLIDNSILEHLGRLPKLVLLSINAITVFKFSDLQDFVEKLDPVTNQGIKVELLNQWYEVKLTDEEEIWLNDYLADNFNGRIAFSYPNDPDELHEADFSDSD